MELTRRATTALMLAAASAIPALADAAPAAPVGIRAFCVDFNWWGPGGFAPPGTFAQADPEEHLAWYRNLGANVIQTFCVSCDGYSWFRGKVAPVQPGMEGDFLRELADLGHRQGMKVMGYFCVGANRYWGEQHPELSHGAPSAIHIPLTKEYLQYLCDTIRDAILRTRIDGFMIDWVFNPEPEGQWLECERRMYVELLGKPFPGAARVDAVEKVEFGRRAVDRAWQRIRRAAKSSKPDCIIWLSSHDLANPQQKGSPLVREVDWLMTEGPSRELLDCARSAAGPHARVIQCVCGWGAQHTAGKLLADYADLGIGFYGFAMPWPQTTLPPTADQAEEASGGDANLAERLRGNARNIEEIRHAWTKSP